MNVLKLLLLILLVQPVLAMSLEEAARQLGSTDEKVVAEAQATLRRGGWKSLGLLDGVIFTAPKVAAVRAKHCRRCILHDVPLKMPDDLLEQLFSFHRLTPARQSVLLRTLSETPFITARTYACLHSRVAERDLNDPVLRRIESWMESMIRDEGHRHSLTLYEPRLLVAHTQAVLLNALDRRFANPEEVKAYARWVELQPDLPKLLNESGSLWEQERLRRIKADRMDLFR